MLLRKLLITIILAASAAGAVGGEERAPSVRMTFLPDGAVVDFDRPTVVDRFNLSVVEDDGARVPVLIEPMHDRAVVRHRLFFPLEDRRYVLEVLLRGEESPLVVEGPPPAAVRAPVSLLIQVPYVGDEDITERWRRPRAMNRPFFPPGAGFTVEVELMTWSKPVDGRLELTLGKGLRPDEAETGWVAAKDDAGRTVLSRKVRLASPMHVRQWLLPLTVTAGEGDTSSVSVRFEPATPAGGAVLERSSVIHIVSTDKLTGLVDIVEVQMPADARGARDIRKPRDTLVLPSRAGLALRRFLGVSERYRDYEAPFAYQALRIRSRSDAPLPVKVSVHVTSLANDDPLPEFQPPAYISRPGEPFVTTATLRPGEETVVPLPVYIRTDRLLPGQYRAIVRVVMLGTDQELARIEHVFGVRTTDVRAFVVTVVAMVLSIGGVIFFLARQRRIFSSFRVSELVLIALFATMTFVLVIFPGSILGPIFSVVAGPFAFLIQGIFFEALRVLVLVTLLMLVPRVGTVTLVSLVRYLIGGLLFGGFTPVDVFYLGTSVVLMETVLLLAGITTRRGVLSRREIGLRSILYVALAFGLVNAATQYVTYCLNISFYRLYFAEWFIWLSVIVSGFLYAALGAVPGMKLGLRLRRISE